MTDLLAAVGLVLAIEGTLYAVAPGGLKAMMRAMQDVPEQTLRLVGVVVLAVGVGVVWAARG